jgi:hypothetical protein
LNSVVTIQSAVRAFLVRKQQLIPKLRTIAATRGKVQSVVDQNDGLLEQVAAATTFEKKTKMAILVFEEELTRALISLDGLSVGGSELVRDARKALVRDIQAVLSKIDPLKAHYKQLETQSTAQAAEPATPTPAPVPISPVELPSVSIPIVEGVSSSTADPETGSEEVEQKTEQSAVSDDAMAQYEEERGDDDDITENYSEEEPDFNDASSSSNDVVMTEASDPSATVHIEDTDCEYEETNNESSVVAYPDPSPIDDFYVVPIQEIPTLKQMCRARVQSVMKAMSGNRISFDDIHSGRATVNIVV